MLSSLNSWLQAFSDGKPESVNSFIFALKPECHCPLWRNVFDGVLKNKQYLCNHQCIVVLVDPAISISPFQMNSNAVLRNSPENLRKHVLKPLKAISNNLLLL